MKAFLDPQIKGLEYSDCKMRFDSASRNGHRANQIPLSLKMVGGALVSPRPRVSHLEAENRSRLKNIDEGPHIVQPMHMRKGSYQIQQSLDRGLNTVYGHGSRSNLRITTGLSTSELHPWLATAARVGVL